MPCSDEELKKLDVIARNLTGKGKIKYLTIPTPSGLVVEITEEKYREVARTGRNPITQIVNVTSTATATSSLSVSQKIQEVIHDLEKSNVSSRKLSAARGKLNTLENELGKPNPSEKVIRKIMRWASDFSLELFLRLAAIIAERLLKPM